VNAPPTIEPSVTEQLSCNLIRAGLDRLRTAAAENAVVKLTPDAALAIADLIELLAGQAGIDVRDQVRTDA
jgi:hypothetical protein